MSRAAGAVEEVPKGLRRAELRARLTGQPAIHSMAPELQEATERVRGLPGDRWTTKPHQLSKLGAGVQEESCRGGSRCSQNLGGEQARPPTWVSTHHPPSLPTLPGEHSPV